MDVSPWDYTLLGKRDAQVTGRKSDAADVINVDDQYIRKYIVEGGTPAVMKFAG